MSLHDQLPRYNATEGIGVFVADLRAWIFGSKAQAGRTFGLSHTTIVRYENGQLLPPIGYVACLAQMVGERMMGMPPSAEMVQVLLQSINRSLRDCYPETPLFRDWEQLCACAAAYRQERMQPVRTPEPFPQGLQAEAVPKQIHIDWGEAPNLRQCYGRHEEMQQIVRWIADEQSQLVGIWGMGGIGKTTLAVHVVQNLADRYDSVIWRSLLNAPRIETIIVECLQVLAGHEPHQMPDRLDQQLSALMAYLRSKRCLLVLDNAETILCGGQAAGNYSQGYDGYAQFLRRIGETAHQSCVLLTSREQPKDMPLLERSGAQVRTLTLAGVSHQSVRTMVEPAGISGTEDTWAALSSHYGGNPLALKLVAATIRNLFNGSISAFLQHGAPIFGDIREILDQQFERLSAFEQAMFYWLAIERDTLSLEQFRARCMPDASPHAILEAVGSLQRRSLLEPHGARFSLQHVIMEYVTERFVEHVCRELVSGSFELFMRHALLLAEAPDDIREAQERLFVVPIAQRLITQLGRRGLEERLYSALARLRQQRPPVQGYAAGNSINLLCYLQCDLRGADFSDLVVWQAYLQGACLQDVDFSRTDLTGSIFRETFASILCVAASTSVQCIAAGMNDGDIRLWYLQDRRPLLTCKGHSDWVRSLVFSPDGRTLVSGSDDQTVRVWDVATGRCRMVIPAHIGRVLSVAMSPDGKLIFSGGEDRLIHIWDVQTGQCSDSLQGHSGWVCSLTVSADGEMLASAGQDKSVRLWDLASGHCRATLYTTTEWFWSVAISPDKRWLAAAGDDQLVSVWNLSSLRLCQTLRGHSDPIWSVSFNAGGDLLASSSNDHTVRVWDVLSGACLHVLQGHTAWVRSLAFIGAGDELVSGGNDQTLRVWNVRSGRCRYTLQGHTDWICCLCFSPDGAYVAAGGNRTVAVWDISTGQRTHVLSGHIGWVWSVAWSPAGGQLASVSQSAVRMWDTTVWQESPALHGHTGWIRSVAFSADGARLATASEDGTVRVWDHSGYPQILRGHSGWVWSAVFSADGERVVSGGDDRTVRVWQVTGGSCQMVLSGHTNSIWSVAASCDGRLIASGSDDYSVRLWDMASGECLHVLHGHSGQVRSVAFGCTTALLASASADQSIRLWDVVSGACRATLQGHTNRVRAVLFSPDDRLLASSADDETIRIWDVATGGCLQVLRGDRPYERMKIHGAVGLTAAQREMLKALGAEE